jgi:hypothetical protein
MKLITESLDVEFLLEEANGKKSYYIEGPFIQMEVKNRNGRAYPKAHIYEEVCRYVTEKIDQRNSFGELGHPSGSDDQSRSRLTHDRLLEGTRERLDR